MLALAAMLAVMLAVTACGGSDNSAAPSGSTDAAGQPPARPTGTLRVALAGQPQSLDPTRDTSNFDLPVMSALYDGLLARNPDSFDKLSPALATSWKSNDDATEWTFELRRGVTFSDGAPFDATAAKKSLELYMGKESVFPWAIGPIDKIETPDDYTLVVSYKEPFPDLAAFMPLVKMMSPKLLAGPIQQVQKRVATHAAGTGPYILDSFAPSGAVRAHANPDYWGDGPHIEQLDFQPIPEESARNAALQAGDVDLVMGLSPRTAQTLSSDPRLAVTTIPSWTTLTLSLATQRKPLDDVLVRQALNYAFDREAIARSVLLGNAEVTGSVAPPGTYGFRRPETQYTYDPAKARALLRQAGVTEPVKLSMVGFTSTSDAGPIGQALAEQAKAAGFDIKFEQLPPAVAGVELDEPQRKWHIFMLLNGWLSGGPFHLAGGLITAHANYKGQKLLDMVSQMSTTPNGPERERIIGDALEEEAKELPEIPLFVMKVSDASIKELQGHVPPQDGFLPNWTQQYLTTK